MNKRYIDTSKWSDADRYAYEASRAADRAAIRGDKDAGEKDAYAIAVAWEALGEAYYASRKRKLSAR